MQSFGLFCDFNPNDFEDLPGAVDSIFGNDPDRDAGEWNELDRRMLSALYNHIPAGSTWEEALEHILVTE